MNQDAGQQAGQLGGLSSFGILPTSSMKILAGCGPIEEMCQDVTERLVFLIWFEYLLVGLADGSGR